MISRLKNRRSKNILEINKAFNKVTIHQTRRFINAVLLLITSVFFLGFIVGYIIK